MWKELAGIGVIIAIISLIFGYVMIRLGKIEDALEKKVDEKMCLQKNQEFTRDLKRGEKDFEDIKNQLKDQGDLLIALDTKVEIILEKVQKV